MFYTKSKERHHKFHYAKFATLAEVKFENYTNYWIGQHYESIEDGDYDTSLDDIHWAHLKNDSTCRIVLYFGDEYFNILDLNKWINLFKRHEIRESQIFLITLDENWAKWAKIKTSELNYNINITHINGLMHMTTIEPPEIDKPTKRFSALSRNYITWRLNLFLLLEQRGLLSQFNYTFNNMHPYVGEIVPLSQVINDTKILGFDPEPEWVHGVPYSLPAPVNIKMTPEAPKLIKASAINVLIESHFDPFINFKGYRPYYSVKDFSPAFPTEKTYKAISCRRPFIAVTTPYFLGEMRSIGYKTFAPFIDETYDLIENEIDRMTAIVNEIERLANLSESDFNELIENMKSITEHNYALLKEKHETIMTVENKFQWLVEYINIEANFN